MSELRELWLDLRSASPSQQVVRALVGLGAALVVLALALAGVGHPVVMVGLVVLGAATVLQPHTLMPALFLVYVVGSWWAGADGWHWALLPAAWGLLLVHGGCALAASVPAQADLPSSVLRRWGLRAGAVAGGTAVVWVLAGLLSGAAGPGGGALPGIVGLLVLVAAVVALTRWSATTGE